MKVKVFTLVFFLIMGGYACLNADDGSGEIVAVEIDGLVCAFCVRAVEKSFRKNDAVKNVDVSLDEATVTVETFEGRSLSDEDIYGIVGNAGYDTRSIKRRRAR